MLAEQVFDQGSKATDHTVTLVRIHKSHDALLKDVAWTQIEFAASSVAKINQVLAG